LVVEARLARSDELHHLAEAADDPDWYETFHLDFAAADASIAGYLIVTLRPSEARSWVWACVIGDGRRLVAVDEPDAPLPRRDALELRAPGLWADVECEIPFDHMTVGLEAFGVAFDDPEDAVGSRRGDRTPLGFDLEWETDGQVSRHGSSTSYEMCCRVTGELLVGDERFELDVAGARSHCWGTHPWWRAGAEAAVPAGVRAMVPVAIPGARRALRSTVIVDPSGARWRHQLG
jgi:hypothetical protein